MRLIDGTRHRSDGMLAVETEMSRLVERELAAHNVADMDRELERFILSYVRRPAKRIRPRILTDTAGAYGYFDERPLRRVAAATELLHIFALMHDDRIDGGGRNGVRPSAVGDELRHDDTYRLLGGDILHAVAIGALVDAVTEFDLSFEIIDTVRSISLSTIAGQAMDVSFLSEATATPDLSRLRKLYDRKTGYYSFVAPLTIAGLIASAPPGGRASLTELGLSLGRAYQFHDDFTDIHRVLGSGADSVPWEFNLVGVFLCETTGHIYGRKWTEPSFRGSVLESLDIDALCEFTEKQISEELLHAERVLERVEHDLNEAVEESVPSRMRELFDFLRERTTIDCSSGS